MRVGCAIGVHSLQADICRYDARVNSLGSVNNVADAADEPVGI